jgi:hypothetical protein
VSVVRYYPVMKTRLRSFLRFISRPKNTSNTNVTSRKRNKQKNLRQFAVRTPTTKQSKKLSWRRRCRFSKNVWKT